MDAMTFVLFGATGDLAKRKIFPALYNLFVDQKLPSSFELVGLGRRQFQESEFQAQVEKSLHSFSRRPVTDPDSVAQFLSMIRYVELNVGEPADYVKLNDRISQREQQLGLPQNRVFYMSVGPELFGPIVSNLKASGLSEVTGWKRLVVEKPFGHDLVTARELNASLSRVFDEHETYRIDHYLGKPMVQNLEVLEYSNPILQALWRNRYVANVQITAAETVGVESRAGYYDHSGALRDMFQNHMLQMLMMLAMQLPKHSTADDVGFKKRKVMESLRALNPEDIAANVVRGQYAAGIMGGQEVVGYKDEPGVAPNSTTDTYIAARLWIDDYFWSEVPFYIRTGKRMKSKTTRIVIEFKDPSDKFTRTNETTTPNLLIIDIGPEAGMTFQINMKNPLTGKLEAVPIHFGSDESNVPEAYEKLIGDMMAGDSTFFAHWDEVELAWQWVEPILQAFEANEVPIHSYPAGSNGPLAAKQLLEADGYHWWLDEELESEQAEAAAPTSPELAVTQA
ncbi:glucose-6-phosphate 1-dehydrogenase [Paenibacillus phyllosphaerae]|uniref:Glucose-6-phosphate 1-dehydrogenase n=1 Tax=Paenibacillus phyllosphaerae TaxID=274593 RepID=A0A7W5AW80_9BACL|nr:glucose-6-phosphate dehydrogenase [Paenibacillus phyllosphaerae]MBB3109807.1 glucose-6-phosphate 1-dehydrogenase [Paenibacillus phyllosphaerae]